MNRRDLLRALAAAPLVGLGAATTRARATGSAKHLIVVLANGGWDVTYCMDPKLGVAEIEGPEVEQDPDNPDDREAVETLGGLPIMVNDAKRPAVRSFFADYGSRVAVVNGIWTGSIAHDPSRERVLSGSADGTVPDMTVVTGSVHGDALPLGSVDMSGFSLAGSLAASTGRVGFRSQLKLLLDDQATFDPPSGSDWSYPQFTPTPEDDDAVRAFLRRRADRFGRARTDGGHNDRRLADLAISLDRSERFAAQATAITDQLNLGREPNLSIQSELAVSFIAMGLCHAVLMDTSRRWDTHTGNLPQHDNYDGTFNGLSTLAHGIEAAGLWDDTVVVVLSEMTRTPKFNEEGGKDHWPHTSALLFGGGVVGGRVRGGTDDLLESLPMNLDTGELDPTHGALCKYDNFAAGVLALVGVDPEPWFPGIRPFLGAMA
ncbi:MAG: hypothetical protein ACI8PZ_004795 [Myxococcota bacterium]|jgi:hypothetical protein